MLTMQDNQFSIHAIGNGHIIAYCHETDVIDYFGAPYSSPSLGTISLDRVAGETAFSSTLRRVPETAAYTYTLQSNEHKKTAVLQDFCAEGKPVWCRTVSSADAPVTFRFHFPDYMVWQDFTDRFPAQAGSGRYRMVRTLIPSGTPVFFNYPTEYEINNIIIFYAADADAANPAAVRTEERDLCFTAANGFFMVVGGPSYPETLLNTEYALSADREQMQQDYMAMWKTFFAGTKDFSSELPADVPLRDELLQSIESCKLAIKVQQDKNGGILAGYPFHLGYVRDQFGVTKGLLQLGMTNEAFAVTEYFLHNFTECGAVQNAHGLSLPHVRHIHENDHVEITGYIVLLVLQCCDTLKDACEKKEYLRKMLPMLEWAVQAQITQLADGMLPFNGDETYIAGGILPRNAIFDGSAEATLLFIDGTQRLIEEVEKLGLSFCGCVSDYTAAIKECREKYRDNFMPDGRLITNNPQRTACAAGKMPRFRHGVCEGSCGYFGWLEKNAQDLYLCPACMLKNLRGEMPLTNERLVYMLKSVSLMPPFIPSRFIPVAVLADDSLSACSVYMRTGKLPSRPDGIRCLGYDYGFLLNSILQLRSACDENPLLLPENDKELLACAAARLYAHTLDITDSTRIWCEFYDDNKPAGTQYRPWESAINICALIDYALSVCRKA